MSAMSVPYLTPFLVAPRYPGPTARSGSWTGTEPYAPTPVASLEYANTSATALGSGVDRVAVNFTDSSVPIEATIVTLSVASPVPGSIISAVQPWAARISRLAIWTMTTSGALPVLLTRNEVTVLVDRTGSDSLRLVTLRLLTQRQCVEKGECTS